MMNGMTGASANGNCPVETATRLGTVAIRNDSLRNPKNAADKNSDAFTNDPVIGCEKTNGDASTSADRNANR